MNATIRRRINAIKDKYKKDPLIVIARADSGGEIKLSLREYLERQDLDFVKVVCGSDLAEVSLLLNSMKEKAEKHYQ